MSLLLFHHTKCILTRLEDFSNRFNFQSTIYFKLWRLFAWFMIYFQLIEYCTLVLSDSNHLRLLTSRREEGGSTFLGSDDPPDTYFISFWGSDGFVAGFGSFFPIPIEQFSISEFGLIDSLSVNHWQVIGIAICRRLTSLILIVHVPHHLVQLESYFRK